MVSQEGAGFGRAKHAASGSATSVQIFLKVLLIVISRPKKLRGERRKKLIAQLVEKLANFDLTTS